MQLKRVYKTDADGVVITPLILDYVKLLRSGPKQKFSTGLVKAAVAEGWMTLTKGRIVLHTKPEVSYKIVRIPGRYCCFSGDKLPDDATGAAAQAHIASNHKGKKSPDKQNPSGYCMLNAYDCVKEVDETWLTKFLTSL